MKPELPTALKQFQHEIVFYANKVELEALSLAMFRWEYVPGTISAEDTWIPPVLTLVHKLTPDAAKELRDLAKVVEATVHVVFQDATKAALFRHEFVIGNITLVPMGCSGESTGSAEGSVVCDVRDEVLYAVVPNEEVESDLEI